MMWPFLTGQKANGFPLDKSLRSKKQKQQQHIRKEKPQQHNFTHRLLAAALKVHGYHAQHTYRFFLCVLCISQTPDKSQSGYHILSLLITSHQHLAINPGYKALESWLHIRLPHLPKGFLITLPASLPPRATMGTYLAWTLAAMASTWPLVQMIAPSASGAQRTSYSGSTAA